MALRLALLLIAYRFAYANFASNSVEHLDRRIFYGRNANISDYPYMVKIHPYKKNDTYCGGSLITDYCVLTAAHCADAFKNASIIVKGGATTLNEPGVMRWVSHIFIPKTFNEFYFTNDVAIMKLDKPLFGNNIKEIPMDFNGLALNDVVKVMGWGITESGTSANVLQTIDVNVMSKEQCQQSYDPLGIWLADSMLCARDKKKDACQGDSGGPVVRNGKQVGVITAGLACGSDSYPGVYTDISNMMVANFIKFIKNKRC